ncbi:heavy-metal-associated domain-containing protein [Raineya orbicola]|jgi:copper chaperone CopZ|uniref:Heavy-metal-associated domain n=1 Tax=Raineya orbicola TaxID=2016530 RepID=A0A2N3ID89_9BACT|nr:heavy metal-associated domain-containing protein [Raineya orbicola]PKQ68260.1 Heavy-metal-associated domain [Raineya orbicola]
MKKFAFLFALMFGVMLAFAQEASDLQEVQIKTSAVCGMCKKKIEKDLSYEKGVVSADLNVETKIVTIKYNPKKTNVTKIKKAINKAGYDADELPANPKAYKKLPECCKKDNKIH